MTLTALSALSNNSFIFQMMKTQVFWILIVIKLFCIVETAARIYILKLKRLERTALHYVKALLKYHKMLLHVNSKAPGPQTIVLSPSYKNDKLHPELQYTQTP